MQEIFDKSFITDIFTNEIYRNKLQVVGYHYLVDHQLMILIVIRLDWPWRSWVSLGHCQRQTSPNFNYWDTPDLVWSRFSWTTVLSWTWQFPWWWCSRRIQKLCQRSCQTCHCCARVWCRSWPRRMFYQRWMSRNLSSSAAMLTRVSRVWPTCGRRAASLTRCVRTRCSVSTPP